MVKIIKDYAASIKNDRNILCEIDAKSIKGKKTFYCFDRSFLKKQLSLCKGDWVYLSLVPYKWEFSTQRPAMILMKSNKNDKIFALAGRV